MLFVSIDEVARYGCYETEFRTEQTYLFNTRTFQFERFVEILEKLDITQEEFYPYDYDYIELFSQSEAQTQREYIAQSKRKDWDKNFKNITDDVQFEAYFQHLFEHDYTYRDWYRYHMQKAREKAIEWCKKNNIPYNV